ncbi:aldo/keto reductase [Paucilactobacillus wasatchensis]|uniref:Oxidoreductase ion channel n=1 Tax=Paucilactobacillus wasatchensis TaxID=1335616 RepID=A0A0D1A640_9LACO|nr:aldo/keto reductase [Paucilactobacillus wasatchensis]KIS03380.1 Oxidoreductase ion channel [Paucilactobacillus wasatchensis]
MKYSNVTIGHSQVSSTPLGLGTNAVGGHNLFPNLNETTGKKVVATALNHGITMLDTAYAYGKGRSEELIGEVIKDFDRHQIILASKAAHIFNDDGSQTMENDPAFLIKAVDASLKRLNTDYLDVFYIHFPDDHTPKYEAVGALQKLKEAGKIRAIGISNFSFDQVQEANQDGYVDVVEDQYSLLHRDNEQQLMPYLHEHQISFVPYFPLASGLLTGKYKTDSTFAAADIRSSNPDFQGMRFQNIVQDVTALTPIATNHHATIAQIILAWYLQNPLISVVIPGAKQPQQVLDNVVTMDIKLTDSEYQTIDHAFDNVN